MTAFRRIWFGFLLATGIAIALSWGGRAALVYAAFVGLTGITAYGAGVASEFLRRVSARRFAPHRPPSL